MAALDNITKAVLLVVIAAILYALGTVFAQALGSLFGTVGSAAGWIIVFFAMLGMIRRVW